MGWKEGWNKHRGKRKSGQSENRGIQKIEKIRVPYGLHKNEEATKKRHFENITMTWIYRAFKVGTLLLKSDT